MFSSMSLSTAATRPKSAEDVCIPAAGDNVEVNCERCFSLAGYVSHPARSRMKSSTYERLAILPAIMDLLYIDEDAVVHVDEYIRRRKANDWDGIESEEDEAFLLLEREIMEEEGYESNSDSDGDGDVDGGD